MKKKSKKIIKQITAILIILGIFLGSITTAFADTFTKELDEKNKKNIEIINNNTNKYPENPTLLFKNIKANNLYENFKRVSASYDYVINTKSILAAGVSSFSVNTINTVESANILTQISNEIESLTEINEFYGYLNIPESRKLAVLTALSKEGKLVYTWGGKPLNKGDYEGLKGLDCSGFVEWCYWTGTGNYREELNSTLMITRTQKEINYDELLPGDIGTITTDGTYYLTQDGAKFYSKEEAIAYQNGDSSGIKTKTNHVGMYIGKDENGQDLWIHCKGNPENTVVIDNGYLFKHYYQLEY